MSFIKKKPKGESGTVIRIDPDNLEVIAQPGTPSQQIEGILWVDTDE